MGRIRVGTCHFRSFRAAVKYYDDYNYDDTEEAVARKLQEGEIKIGYPFHLPSNCSVGLDSDGRYFYETEE